jgi:hypothetical protein
MSPGLPLRHRYRRYRPRRGSQRFFRDVRNIAGDLFRPKLGVTRHHLELVDVDGGEDVVGDDALGEKDRVLVVVAVPRHERDEHVAAERQIAEIGRRTVGDDVALVDHVTDSHQRTLVDAGVLVGALELLQPVDVDARARRFQSSVARITIRVASTWSTTPPRRATIAAPESRATTGFHAGARRTAPRHAPAAPPDAACSSPSARGWRRRSPGTGSGPRPPKPAASARRPSGRCFRAAPSSRRRHGGRRRIRRRACRLRSVRRWPGRREYFASSMAER